MELKDASILLASINKKSSELILGAEEQSKMALAALVSGTHVIVQGPPGTGKSLVIKTLYQLLGIETSHIYCTAETKVAPLRELLEPYFNDETQGGVSSPHICIVDEINRASPDVQASLVEFMEKRGARLSIMATQSSSETDGALPLSEAQLDRFGLIIRMKQPNADQLLALLQHDNALTLEPLCTTDEFCALQNQVGDILLPEKIGRSIAESIAATSPESSASPDIVKRYVRQGAGVRAAQTIAQTAKALALIEGRTEVIIDDIRLLLGPALGHRLSLNFAGFANSIASNSILEAIKHRFL